MGLQNVFFPEDGGRGIKINHSNHDTRFQSISLAGNIA